MEQVEVCNFTSIDPIEILLGIYPFNNMDNFKLADYVHLFNFES